MGYKATHRVKDTNNKTVGFIIDNNFEPYYTVLKNIKNVDNLSKTSNNVIRSKNGSLKVCSIRELNDKIYKDFSSKNSINRDVQDQFKKWRNTFSDDFVLYLSGARQVGKTTEILKFAYKNYEQIIYVNLAEDIKKEAMQKAVKNNSIIFGISEYCEDSGNYSFNNSKSTILIIDEIQESPEIFNSIRTLKRSLKCDIVVTGSYLGRTLNKQYFLPSGTMLDITMMPLSFREFCRVFDKEDLLMSIDLYGGSPKEEYIELTKLYRLYIEVGGYPKVVDTYIKNKDIKTCKLVIKSIVERFTEESSHYFNDSKCEAVFRSVYKAAFMMLSKEKKGTSAKDVGVITDFVKIDTKEYVSRSEINKAIQWLDYSKIIGSCDLYNQGNTNDILYDRRFYFMDCGIARYISDITGLNQDTINGVIAENFVYTELYRLYKSKSESGDNSLRNDKPCCSIYDRYELDFMINTSNGVKYGIEVKSNKSNRHESLDMYLKRELIDEAYLAEITKGGKGEAIRSIPIYTVGCRFPYK